MDLKETIFALSQVNGASGDEKNAAETVLGMLREYCPEAGIINGNVVGKFGEHRPELPSMVLDAHIDQIGLIVTDITSEGFVRIGNLGGIDRRLLPAQRVVIHGKRNVSGVVCSVPPHLSKGSSKVLSFDETAIDTGMTSKELKEIVSPGDSVTFSVKCRSLLGTRITGGAMDDRCGVAAVLYALELLKDRVPEYNVTVVFSVQEELGERGAKTGAFETAPDIAIAVDVSFAYGEGEKRSKCGDMGKGAMIGISPCLSREISDALFRTAKKAGLPFQTEVMNDLTSTNADQYSAVGKGAKTCTVSIPLRYMHTPVEVIDLKDVENTARLLAEYIGGGSE